MPTPSTPDVLIRVYLPSRRLRLSLSIGSSTADLYRQLGSQCGVPEDSSELQLFYDERRTQILRKSTSKTLTEAGLKNGTVLYGSAGPEEAHNAAGSFTEQVSSQTISDELQKSATGPKPPSQTSSSSSSGAPQPPESTTPKFKSFDQFLKERQYSTVDLPLLRSYSPITLVRGTPTIIPPSATLKHQPYRHVDHIEFMNVKEVESFVRYWRFEKDLSEQRLGWLFGYFKEDSHYEMGLRAVMECIYEPPQASGVNSVVFLEDTFLPTAERVAASMGLEVVGWIFTHLPRKELLTAEEVKLIAGMQLERTTRLHYTAYPIAPFVTVTVSLDLAAGNGSPTMNAYMVSDMGMAFERDGLLRTHPEDAAVMKIVDPPKNTLFPLILESGRAVSSFDPDWLIVRVNDSAPKKVRSIWQSTAEFPVENRGRLLTPKMIPTHIKAALAAGTPKGSALPFSNFHILLYVAQLFDAATAESIADCVLNKRNLESSLEEIMMML